MPIATLNIVSFILFRIANKCLYKTRLVESII